MGCNVCHGEGKMNKSPCTNCRGKGTAYKTKKERVNIPAGINTGQNLRVAAKGNSGENGGNKGDLIIKVKVKKDNYFKREGYDVYTEENISVV